MIFTVSKKQWAFVFAYLSMFILGISDNIRGPLFSDLLSHLNLSNSQGSLSFATASAAALVGNLISVLLFKKFTLKDVLSGSLYIMGLGTFCMGYAHEFSIYLLGASFFGFSMGLMGVTQTVIIAESTTSEKQAQAMSGLHGVYGLSSLIAPMIAAFAAAYFLNWQAGFYVASAIAFIFGFLALLFNVEPNFTVHKPLQNVESSRNSFWVRLVVGGIFAFYVMAEIMVSSRLALYMRTYFNMNLEQSSQYVTYFFVFLLAGRLLFALKSFQFSLKAQLNCSLAASLLFLILGLVAHPFFLALTGLSMAPFYPLSISYISEITGIHKRQFFTFALSFQSICVIIMHLGVGYLTDQFGLFYAFGVGILSLVLALVCINAHPKVHSA